MLAITPPGYAGQQILKATAVPSTSVVQIATVVVTTQDVTSAGFAAGAISAQLNRTPRTGAGLTIDKGAAADGIANNVADVDRTTSGSPRELANVTGYNQPIATVNVKDAMIIAG